MGKTIGLKQLAQKVYTLVQGLPPEIINSFGNIEDAFDCILYGSSGNGKSNGLAKILIGLITALKCKCHYVAYEEGHAFTVQETIIHRHNMFELLGNAMQITDHMTYDELFKKIASKQSAKIWVIDSIQASHFTEAQCAELKRRFVLSKKRKIIIYVSWADGKNPKGATAKAVEYYANIKLRIEGFIIFPKSRYGGNQPYIVWEGNQKEGARFYWGKKYEKTAGIDKPKKPPVKKETPHTEQVTHMQIAETILN